jgi:hypothetical protein
MAGGWGRRGGVAREKAAAYGVSRAEWTYFDVAILPLKAVPLRHIQNKEENGGNLEQAA